MYRYHDYFANFHHKKRIIFVVLVDIYTYVRPS